MVVDWTENQTAVTVDPHGRDAEGDPPAFAAQADSMTHMVADVDGPALCDHLGPSGTTTPLLPLDKA